MVDIHARTWADFYRDRVNNPEYEKYFNDKYMAFFAEICYCIGRSAAVGGLSSEREVSVAETGCGTGLVSKILMSKDVIGAMVQRWYLYDSDPAMLYLAGMNIGADKKILMRLADIRHDAVISGWNYDVIYSHGVLEHFSENEIKTILSNQIEMAKFIVHYVPTNGYDKPSFGTENLWPATKWRKMISPDRTIITNKGKDLVMVWGTGGSK